MTALVARCSSDATCSALTRRTRGSGEFGDVCERYFATRSPRSVSVASMMITSERRSDTFVFAARTIGSTMIKPRNTGPRIVAIRNHLDRTRSRNSRLKTTHALPMSGDPFFDIRRADTLEENLMQRRRDQLEAADARSSRDDAT